MCGNVVTGEPEGPAGREGTGAPAHAEGSVSPLGATGNCWWVREGGRRGGDGAVGALLGPLSRTRTPGREGTQVSEASEELQSRQR